jgi:hypothetical protein
MQEDLVKHCQIILHSVVIWWIYARQKVGVIAIRAAVFVDILYVARSYRPCGSTARRISAARQSIATFRSAAILQIGTNSKSGMIEATTATYLDSPDVEPLESARGR